MAKFSIVGMNKKGQPKKFIYDNSTSELTYEDGRPVYVAPLETVDYGDWEAAFTVSKDTPANKSSEEISILKTNLYFNISKVFQRHEIFSRKNER